MSVPPEEHSDPSPDAERLYAQAIVDLPRGGALDLDALCAVHPEHSDSLRRLHEEWQQVRTLRSSATLSDRLKSRFGEDADPDVSLQGQAEPASDFSSEVLSRLSGRQPTASRYKLEGEVARGGMGAILRVWDEDLRRHLAMKVVLGQGEPTAKGGTPEVPTATLARFLEEAQVTGQLDHPGIVPVHELGLDAEGQVYFTMKLVKGVTLKAVFDELAAGQGGWTQTRVLSLILRVCEAMAYAHDKQVIHRDLKPANVMVGRFGEVYVMDWGLAKILGREDGKDLRVKAAPALLTSELRSDRKDHAGETPDSPLYTMDGDVVGTPAYMSPEQAAGNVDAMGPVSDVYALGAMLYHLLAGHMPYVPKGARLNNYSIWGLVQQGPPRALHEIAPEVPAELVAICEKAMAREAKDRYANTSELADDLSAYIEGRVVQAYETGAGAEARKWVMRNKALAGAMAAAAVLLVVGLVSSLALKAQSDTNAKLADAKAEEARLNAERADTKTREAEQNLTLAQRNEAEAQAQRDRAEENERLAREETLKVLRLSDVKVLQELEAEVDALWPAYPEQIPVLGSWIERASALVGGLSGHRSTLAEMRSGALGWSAEERSRDRATHPRLGELETKRAELEELIAQLDQGGLSGDALEAVDARAVELEAEVAALVTQVESRQSWSFNTQAEDWQHAVLAELIGNLEGLESGLLAEDAVTAEHGWSVARRLSFARELESGIAAGGEHAEEWAAALPAIREAYPGLELAPQMGLVPIGSDPDSGLWEFAHLMTGTPAQRGSDGKLIPTKETGVVLVLIPGGAFWMGAQASDPTGRNYDPQVESDEGPVREVKLSAYFLSKYELTQGQWKRLTGRNPSNYGPDGRWSNNWLASGAASSPLHPVEQVSWQDCMLWLPRAGLGLPSEAQWERGARGGTETPFWSGTDLASLEGVANLSDAYGKRNGNDGWTIWEADFDDGSSVHWTVGRGLANGFGLHDVHGNLWEWCLDGYDGAFYGGSPVQDPLAPWANASNRVCRGGSFAYAAVTARAANRSSGTPSDVSYNFGVRPARVITQ